MEIYYYWLACLVELGIAGLERFVDACGGVQQAFDMPKEKAVRLENFTPGFMRVVLKSRDISRLWQEYHSLAERGIHFVSRVHGDFPEKLKALDHCPFGLFYTGALPRKPRLSIAIVGARAATPCGQEMARWFARELALRGVEVVSGLALGIDGFAHRGALEALDAGGDGRTYGVLGCGINICYPRENIHIFEAMKNRGGLLSEFAPGVSATSWHFPYRNRIISGLADGVLVVEAKARSGSLITVNYALDQGKPVFAVPGRPVDALSAGCNRLIEDGACMVTRPEHILEEFGLSEATDEDSVNFPRKNNIVLANLEKLVYSSLCLDAKSIGQISAELRLDYGQTTKLLFELVKKGCVRQVGRNYFICKL